MQKGTLPKVLLAGGLSLGIGAAAGELIDLGLNAAYESPSEQIQDINNCASQLGNTAVRVETPPSPCYRESPRFIPIVSDSAGNTFYSLPTATKMHSYVNEIPGDAREQYEDNKALATVSGSLMALSMFGLFLGIRRINRQYEGPGQRGLRLVK